MARAPFRVIALAAVYLARPALADVPAPVGPPEPPPATTAMPAPAETSSAAAPASPTGAAPTPSTPTPAPASVPPRAAPPSPPPSLPAPPTDAIVHLAANYDAARLEARSLVDADAWHVLCEAPCDRPVRVEGFELRVTAPRMTPTNVFLVEPGPGTARFRVSGGSATARELGIIGLVGGLPVAFAGMSLFGLGSVQESPKERTAGIVTLAVGAAVTVIALPLLLFGSSSVKNEQGKYIARRATRVPLL